MRCASWIGDSPFFQGRSVYKKYFILDYKQSSTGKESPGEGSMVVSESDFDNDPAIFSMSEETGELYRYAGRIFFLCQRLSGESDTEFRAGI